MARTIAVTGKGGTGKTSIAALLVKYLREHAAGPILALDADPDANLGAVLGISTEQTIGDLREETLKQIKSLPAGMSKAAYIEAGLHEVIVESDKVDLITMGCSEGPSCYCYINSLIRKFADDLQSAYEWLIMDTEAGLEHLSRRTSATVECLIGVINESPLSINCVRNVEKIINQFKQPVRHKYFLINAVPEEKIDMVREKASGLTMKYLGFVPYDPALNDLIMKGESLYKLDNTPAVAKIAEIMKRLDSD